MTVNLLKTITKFIQFIAQTSEFTVLWIRKLKVIFLHMGLTNAFLLCKSDHHNFLFLHTAHDQKLDSWMAWYTVYNGENSQSLHRNKNVCSIFCICFFSEPFHPPSALRYTLAPHLRMWSQLPPCLYIRTANGLKDNLPLTTFVFLYVSEKSNLEQKI